MLMIFLHNRNGTSGCLALLTGKMQIATQSSSHLSHHLSTFPLINGKKGGLGDSKLAGAQNH